MVEAAAGQVDAADVSEIGQLARVKVVEITPAAAVMLLKGDTSICFSNSTQSPLGTPALAIDSSFAALLHLTVIDVPTAAAKALLVCVMPPCGNAPLITS